MCNRGTGSRFLAQVHRHPRKRLILVWDRLSGHRSGAVSRFLRAQRHWLWQSHAGQPMRRRSIRLSRRGITTTTQHLPTLPLSTGARLRAGSVPEQPGSEGAQSWVVIPQLHWPFLAHQ